MTHLEMLRRSFARFLIPLIWTHVLILVGSEMLLSSGIPSIGPIGGAVGLASLATLLWLRDPIGAATRVVSAVVLISMVALLLIVFAGHSWQIDLHMYFFACLAVLVGWCDWRTILAATAAIAIHHLVLDLAMPALVFPGDTVDLARVVLHAAIVLIEAGVLIWVCRTVARSFTALAASEQETQTQLARAVELENEAEEARSTTAMERRAEARNLANAFEATVGHIIAMVSSSATELQNTAQAMNATATQTANQSSTVAAAAEEAAVNVNTVAAAAEELGSSVHEIGRRADDSATLAQIAVSEADQTGALMKELSATVSRIGSVVDLISSIAGQTNLLALNATIEAARAGEAGCGFTVVAAEVKGLASQTARATREISDQIIAIQASTDQAVSAIGSITTRIQEISGLATSIAMAVEEQAVATQEIVRNVSQAAAGTSEVTNGITAVAGGVDETGNSASNVLSAASTLSHQSVTLAAELERFLVTIRAA